MRDYSNYTGINTTEKIKRDAFRMLEDSLNGYASFDCIVAPNGDNDRKFATRIQITQKYDSNGESMKVIGRIGEIERGNYIYYNDQVWLVTTKPEDNETYRKAEVSLCSTELPVKEHDTVTITGLDDIGRPIKVTQQGTVTLMPCVLKFNDASTAIADVNKPINLLDNIITLTIPYKEAPSIAYDAIFTVYNDQYRIIRIDASKSIMGIGILKITGSRLERDD